MIKAKKWWAKDGRIEISFVDEKSGDEYEEIETLGNEIVQVLEKYLNEKEERWGWFKERVWAIANEKIGRGGNILIQICDCPNYHTDGKQKYLLGFTGQEPDYFSSVKWILEDILTMPHKSEPFLIFENHWINELVEE